MIQIKHNKLRIPTVGRLISWLLTRRGGAEFGVIEDKFIQRQGEGFEPGSSAPYHWATLASPDHIYNKFRNAFLEFPFERKRL